MSPLPTVTAHVYVIDGKTVVTLELVPSSCGQVADCLQELIAACRDEADARGLVLGESL